ncbi:MAG: rod shape-determining protein [Clostridiales bacterium]|nr:rod shape-determining protein [Clostridiales bacterium]
MINKLFGLSPALLAIDLGTVNSLVAISGFGVVLNEATAAAVSGSDERDVLAVGNEAVEMCGRTPSGVKLKFPFTRGVIADYSLSEYMIREFIDKAMQKCKLRSVLFGPKVLLCVPNCITEVERHALHEAAKHAGAQDVYIAEEIMAACIGANMQFRDAVGSLAVDIGGGTTDAAVIALGGVAAQSSIRVGGNAIDEDIANYVRKMHNISIGLKTAENLKIELGKATDLKKRIKVCGLGVETSLPRYIDIEIGSIAPAFESAKNEIVDMICDVLSNTPPELASDIMKTGIVLTGGGANLFGLADSIHDATKIEVKIAEKPLECVVNGALTILEMIRGKRSSVYENEYSMLIG